MKLLFSLFSAIFCVFLGGIVLQASTTNEAPPFSLAKLYSSHFLLSSRGIPQVTVGLADAQNDVIFSLPSGGWATFYDRRRERIRKIRLKSKRRYRLHLQKGQKAQIRYNLSIFQVPLDDERAWKRSWRRWIQKGLRLKSQTIGSVFAINGQLFDNRIKLAILSSFSSYKTARKMADRLAMQQDIPIHIHAELTRLPHAQFLLKGPWKSWQIQDLVEIHERKNRFRLWLNSWPNNKRWQKHRARSFYGDLIFAAGKHGKIAVINRLPLPEFLKGVLPAEMPYTAPLEALKAQAICARNEILAKIGTRHLTDPYLFCARTHCQVYAGRDALKPRTTLAVLQTKGEVMLHSPHRLVDASYSAVCGGFTENNENVWNGPPNPNTRGVSDLKSSSLRFFSPKRLKRWLTHPPDAYCNTPQTRRGRKFRWRVNIPAYKMDELVRRHYKIGKIKEIIPLKRGVSGRIYTLKLRGTRREVIVRGELRIRRLFGGLSSSLFIVEPHYFREDVISWTFIGGGWGHGVGLCQHGAMGRARAGQHYRKILHHYFSQMRLTRIY